MMLKKIEELQSRVPAQHKDIAKYTQHAIEAIDKMVEEHVKLVSSQAVAGIKPNGVEEKVFYEQANLFKKILLIELEKTVQDLEHKGDKHWDKNFKDGVLE